MSAKTKQKDVDASLKEDWIDSIRDSDFFNKLIEQRRNLPYIFLVMVLVIGISFKFMSGRSQRAESNFLLAENYKAKIIRSITAPNGISTELNALNDLDKINQNYPELQPKYDGMMGQLYLINGDLSYSEKINQRVTQRTGNDQYLNQHDLTKTTYNIAKGNYKEALAEAKALQGKLSADEKTTLAYNVLRMAMLQQELGDVAAEREIWDLWKTLSQQPNNSESFALVADRFKEGDFTLTEYINERNRVIASRVDLQKK